MFYFETLFISLLSLNLCLIHLSSDIFYGMVDIFLIYLFALLYERFLIKGFINQ